MATKKERAEVELIINGSNANHSLRDLEAAARKAKSELRGMMPGTEEFKKAAENVARIDRALVNTRVQAGLVKSSWDKMKESIKTTFIGNLGANLATLGLQKVASYFTDAWDAAKKLSDQMADMGRTTGLTTEEVKALNSELSKIDTRTSLTDLREMAIVAGQFGVAKQDIVGFVKAIDQVNIVMGGEFGGNAEAVATEMSKLRNIFTDIKSDDIGNDIGFISNAINKLAQEGVATAPVVSDLANRIGGYGIQVGLTTGQVLGLSATLQELNVSAERGGTAVVKIMQKMLTNTSTFAEVAGMSVEEFKLLLNEDLFGAFKKVMKGSQELGGQSTELAAIIKEMEVQGAGASEVFAKLGSNMEMLNGKVELSNSSLTNTNSISEQAQIKQDNLAGAVEKLSKAWNKLTANPAVVDFFKFIVDQTTTVIDGMSGMADMIVYNYNLITKGKAEADKLFLADHEKNLQDQLTAENKSMEQRVAGVANGLKQMTVAEIKETIAKKEALYKSDMAFAKGLNAVGKFKQSELNIQLAKETSMEIKAAKEILKAKEAALKQGLNTKVHITEEMIKAQEKQDKADRKSAQKAAKEIAKELNDRYKLQIKHYEDLFKEAEKYWDEHDKLFLKNNKEDWEKSREFFAREIEAAAELGGLKATNDEEARIAEIDRVNTLYNERITAVKEGSEQEKLLRAQLRRDIDLINSEYDQKEIDKVKEIANLSLGVWNSLLNRKAAIDTNKLAKQNAADEREKAALKKQLDDKVISQMEYDSKIDSLNQNSQNREREARREMAKQQKAFAVFDAVIKAALAVMEAIIKPTKWPQAIAAGIQAGIIAATPIPEFEQGGFTGSTGMGSYNGKTIAGVTHPNEFVINAKQLQNPYVYNMAKELATDKSASSISSSGGNFNSGGGASDQILINVLMALNTTLKQGISQKIQIDEEFAFKLNRELKKQQTIDEKGLF
jgi:TP901 family phage tail tape measure protein